MTKILSSGLTERGFRMLALYGRPELRTRCACCGISEVEQPVWSRLRWWSTQVVGRPIYVITCGSYYCRAVAARGGTL